MIAKIYTVYSIQPIDYGWKNLLKLADHPEQEAYRHVLNYILSKLEKVVGDDDREQFRITYTPYSYDMEPLFYAGFAWKSDNNGDTCIVSPIKLYCFENSKNFECYEKETVYIPSSVRNDDFDIWE